MIQFVGDVDKLIDVLYLYIVIYNIFKSWKRSVGKKEPAGDVYNKRRVLTRGKIVFKVLSHED